MHVPEGTRWTSCPVADFLGRHNTHTHPSILSEREPHDRPKKHPHQGATWLTNEFLLRLLTGVWVRGHLQDQVWLKNSCITRNTQQGDSSQNGNPGALCTSMQSADRSKISPLCSWAAQGSPPTAAVYFSWKAGEGPSRILQVSAFPRM